MRSGAGEVLQNAIVGCWIVFFVFWGIAALRAKLIRHRPYAHVRHPIYSAILLMLLGTALAIGTLGALLGLPLVGAGIWLKVGQEEALTSEHFPAEYAAYRSRVKALVPHLL